MINLYSTPCELRYLKDNRTIVEFPTGLEGKPIFAKEAEHIESAMIENGIPIPNGQKDDFPELTTRKKAVIRLTDKSFGKAFYEIYFGLNMKKEEFMWQFKSK